jgi:hypothetical protein
VIYDQIQPNTYEFANRFSELKSEASKYGIKTVTVILNDDPMDKTEAKIVLFSGGHMKTVGMLEYAKYLMLSEAKP